MKKIGIITINDDTNFGNRLQNYALYKYINKMGFDVETIKNTDNFDSCNKFQLYKNNIKNIIKKFSFKKDHLKYSNFRKFNKNIKFSKKYISKYSDNFDYFNRNYDIFVVGSDQVWNPTFGRFNKLDLLSFTSNKKISYAASFGIDDMSKYLNNDSISYLKDFDLISVREEMGKKILNDAGINNVDVLIDPTLLLDENDWYRVIKSPKRIPKKKFILNYFLGNMSQKTVDSINEIAKKYDCEVINILDKESDYYTSGPSEFLWLEKNAFLICTDSFHSSVFAFLFNRPFVIFERDDNFVNMSSRLKTLISKFELDNRYFNNNDITDENINHDYSNGYKILENERKKSKEFLEKAFDIKK